MKKILNFFFLLIAFQGFSQSIDLNFTDPKTNRPSNPHNIVNVDVTYNRPTKVTLKLLFKDVMTQSDSFSWMIVDLNHGTIGNSNYAQIANSEGMITFYGRRSRDITFTIHNNNNQNSTRQLVFELRGTGSNPRYTSNYRVFINVNNLRNPKYTPNGNPYPDPVPNPNPNPTESPIPLCSDNTIYNFNRSRLEDGVMDHARPNVFYKSVIIKNSKIAARRVTINGESHIYPNTTISSKSCRDGKNLQTVENNMFEPTIFENKINLNQLTASPNPTSGQVQINSKVDINDWYVYDINAKIVLNGNNKNKNSLKISLDNLPAGIYYFKFFDSLGILNEKTIIKK